MANPAIQNLLEETHQWSLRDQKRAAQQDPKGHRTTRVFDGSTNYRYWPAKERAEDGSRVWFCWSCHKNVAGYYLAWLEIRDDDGGRRIRYTAHKIKRSAKELSERCRDQFDAESRMRTKEALAR